MAEGIHVEPLVTAAMDPAAGKTIGAPEENLEYLQAEAGGVNESLRGMTKEGQTKLQTLSNPLAGRLASCVGVGSHWNHREHAGDSPYPNCLVFREITAAAVLG